MPLIKQNTLLITQICATIWESGIQYYSRVNLYANILFDTTYSI